LLAGFPGLNVLPKGGSEMRASQPASVVKFLPNAPALLDLHAVHPDRYPALLESASGAGGAGRYDILFAFPGDSLTLSPLWTLTGPGQSAEDADFLEALDGLWQGVAIDPYAGELPFNGGWFVYLGYELAQQIEPGLKLGAEAHFPVARAIRIPAAVVFDRKVKRSYIVAEASARDLVGAIEEDIERTGPGLPLAALPPGACSERDSLDADDPEIFLEAVRGAQAHIRAGDIYQANISRQWRGRLREGVEPWMLYQRLRGANPAPFAGLLSLGGAHIISSSPERLAVCRNGVIETRPIAGTRPRRRSGVVDDDAFVRRQLAANTKEQAEHVMLLDLERNDLGRVCQPGTVQVAEFMRIESYAHVHHIESTVTGLLRKDVTPATALRALFPGGTITGCPKVRCMEIIRALEGRCRGPYTGSMGYINRDGSFDFNILIRTIALAGSSWQFNAGSGIVADSVPLRELEESEAKAKGMLLALTDVGA